MRHVRTMAAQWREPQLSCKTSKEIGCLDAASSTSNWIRVGVAVDFRSSIRLQNVLETKKTIKVVGNWRRSLWRVLYSNFIFASNPYFIVFSSNFIRWYLRSTSCSLLMPNCPSQLFPKLKSSPCFVTANVWLSPVYSYTTHKILGSKSTTYMENRRSVGRDKNTDGVRETKSFMPAATLMTLESLRSDLVRTSRPWKSPRPSCPDVLLPQEYISPYKVAMTVCDAPHATETMGRRISSCEKAFWLIPSTPLPSCPK